MFGCIHVYLERNNNNKPCACQKLGGGKYPTLGHAKFANAPPPYQQGGQMLCSSPGGGRGGGHKWNWLMHYRAKKFSHTPSFNIATV